VKVTFILFFILVCTHALAQGLDLGGGLYVSQEQLETLRRELPRTQEDRTFYHWTSRTNAMRWVTQKYINSGEMAFLNRPSTVLQVYGPGFYIAENPMSSRDFGEAPVSLIVKKGTQIYDAGVVSRVLKTQLSNEKAAILADTLQLLRPAKNDWYVLNNSAHTQDIFYAAFSDPKARTYVSEVRNGDPFKVAGDFRELIQSGDQDARYLRDILFASEYMDGISFARAMKVNPGAPWQEFEPEGFESYKNAIESLSHRVEEIRKAGTEKTGDALFEVINKLNGDKFRDVKEAYRTEGIRAGGDEPGQTFKVTKDQLKALEDNPYLEVVSMKQGDEYLVHYFYPDAFHFKKLKGRISDELYQWLSQLSPDEIMKNNELRQSLNKQIIDELLSDFLVRKKKNEATWSDLVSIHPFVDKNGRTVRLLQKIYEPEYHHSFIGDFDLLEAKDKQYILLDSSSSAHRNLQADLIDEFLRAKTQKRAPDYLKTGALEKYVNDAFPYPVKIDLSSATQLEQIRKRQWVELTEGTKDAGMAELENFLKKNPDPIILLKRMDKFTHPSAASFYTDSQKEKLLGIIGKAFDQDGFSTHQKIGLAENYRNVHFSSSKAPPFEDQLKKISLQNFEEFSMFNYFLSRKVEDPFKKYEIFKAVAQKASLDTMNEVSEALFVAYRELLNSKQFSTLSKDVQTSVISEFPFFIEPLLKVNRTNELFELRRAVDTVARQLQTPEEVLLQIDQKFSPEINKVMASSRLGRKAELYRGMRNNISLLPERTKAFLKLDELKEGILQEIKLEVKKFADGPSDDFTVLKNIFSNLGESEELPGFLLDSAKETSKPQKVVEASVKIFKSNLLSSGQEARRALLKKTPEFAEKLLQLNLDRKLLNEVLNGYDDGYEALDYFARKDFIAPAKMKIQLAALEQKYQTQNCQQLFRSLATKVN
jgi:hypothetical protein